MVPRGTTRSRRAFARQCGRPADSRGWRRIGDVLAVASHAWRPTDGGRPFGRDAAPRSGGRCSDWHRDTARTGRRAASPVPGRHIRPRVHRFWGGAFRGRFRASDARSGARATPGRRWVLATSHPFRWVFPDDPGPAGLTATMSYFDRTPYVEFDARGEATYVEHHRTLGDRVAEINAAGFRLAALIEPEWPDELTQEWGQWSPLRGAGDLAGTRNDVCELT